MDDHELDTVLSRRAYLEPSDDLAQRIIAQAAATPQKKTVTILEWIERLFVDLQLPRPAYSFASVLLLGVVLGMSFSSSETEVIGAELDIASTSMQAFLYADEELL